MKIALFGGSGVIGSRILWEALERGHHVTAVVRDPTRVRRTSVQMDVVKGDVLDPIGVATCVRGHDAVFAAVGPEEEVILGSARSLLKALPVAGVKRLLIVGGAGSLEIAPGRLFLNDSHFPMAYRNQARANYEALEIYRRNDFLDWTIASPPVWIAPGERTRKFRLGRDQLLVGMNGESRISAEDFAVAFLDEAESPQHVRRRFTVAY